MTFRRRIWAIALVALMVLGLVTPASGQEAPTTEDEAEPSPCAPPEPEPTPEVPVQADGTAPPVVEVVPETAPVERPPELAFVNGRCIPIAELSRLLAQYEGAVAEEAEALIELREQLEAIDELNRQLDEIELALAEVRLREAAAESETRFAAQRQEIADLELAIVRSELADQRELLRDQAVAAYVSGGDPSQTVQAAVLEAADLNDIGSTKAYGRVIVEGQVDQVLLVEALESAATLLEAELTEAQEHAVSVEANVEEIRISAEELRAQQLVLIDDAEIAAEEQAQLVANIQQRRDEFAGQLGIGAASGGTLGTVLGALGDGTASLANVGRLSTPLANTGVSSGFGPRLHPIFNEMRMHTGLDLNSPAGAPIFAVAPGRVVVAGEEGGYGLAIAIDHGDGIATLYAHQSAFAVGIGAEVEAGDVIGFIGSTGFSTGPHLHFELRLDGLPVDALPFIDLTSSTGPADAPPQTENP